MLGSTLWPSAAVLAAMPYGVLAGAAIGLGVVVIRWRAKPGVFGEIQPRRFIPGEPVPADMPAEPWGPAGVQAAVLGAVVGAGLASIWAEPDSMENVGLLFAAIALVSGLHRLIGVTRDIPAVGEPPRDSAEESPAVRLRRAWESLALAAGGLLMAAYGAGWL